MTTVRYKDINLGILGDFKNGRVTADMGNSMVMVKWPRNRAPTMEWRGNLMIRLRTDVGTFGTRKAARAEANRLIKADPNSAPLIYKSANGHYVMTDWIEIDALQIPKGKPLT